MSIDKKLTKRWTILMPLVRLIILYMFVQIGNAQQFIDLSMPVGGLYIGSPAGINYDGSVVVGTSPLNPPTNFIKPIRWSRSAGYLNLGTLPTGNSARALGISPDGSVVLGNSGSANYYGDGVRWTASTGMKKIGFSIPAATTWNGTVIVGIDNNSRAARLIPGTPEIIEPLPIINGNSSSPTGISYDGSVIVGNSYVGLLTLVQALRWTFNGSGWTAWELGVLRTGSKSAAIAVSGNGSTIIGNDIAANGSIRAFRWTESTGIQGLGLPPNGSTGVQVNDVNANGTSILGTSFKVNSWGTDYRAVLWRQGIGWRDLTTYLPTLGISLNGRILEFGAYISGDGQSMLGTANGGTWLASLGPPLPPPAALEFVDPNPFARQDPFHGLPLPYDTSYSDPQSPESLLDWSPTAIAGATPVIGAACDGVTRVAIKWPVSGPGTATISVADEVGLPLRVGMLGLPGQLPTLTTLTNIPAIQVGNAWYIQASYAVPYDFQRSANDDNKINRLANFTATFTPTTGAVQVQTSTFQLVRPPVLLLHGYHSGSSSWSWNLLRDTRFVVWPEQYQDSSERPFAENIRHARWGAGSALSQMRHRGYAATQVSVVGHSMGGILARLHAGGRENNYYRRANLGLGDFYKLITLYTPHYGSGGACFAERWLTTPTAQKVLPDMSSLCLNCGAIHDLRPDSFEIQHLPAITIPVHTISGSGGSQALNDLAGGTLYTPFRNPLLQVMVTGAMLANIGIPLILDAPIHDIIVGQPSARGGLSGLATNDISARYDAGYGLTTGIHMGVGEEQYVGDQIIRPLLDSSISSTSFAAGMPANTNVSIPPICTMAPRDFAIAPSDSLHLSTTGDVKTVAAGGVVQFRLDPSAAFGAQKLLLETPFGLATIAGSSRTFSVRMPSDVVGKYQFNALAVNALSTIAVANPISIDVTSTAALQSIEPTTPWIFLDNLHSQAQLSVFGHYQGGITRDIHSAASGTTYRSIDPKMVIVSPNGVLTGASSGQTQVIISNGLIESHIDVVVDLRKPH